MDGSFVENVEHNDAEVLRSRCIPMLTLTEGKR